jgi:hypothetical protein
MKSSGTPNPTGRRFGTIYFLFFAIYGITPYLQVILRKLGYSPAAVGLFLGLFELVGIAGPIVLARKADALGRFNPFLIASGLGIILGMGLLVSVNHAIAAVIGLGFASLSQDSGARLGHGLAPGYRIGSEGREKNAELWAHAGHRVHRLRYRNPDRAIHPGLRDERSDRDGGGDGLPLLRISRRS